MTRSSKLLRIGVGALVIISFTSQLLGKGRLEPKDDGLFGSNPNESGSRNLRESQQNSSLKPLIEHLESSLAENIEQMKSFKAVQEQGKQALPQKPVQEESKEMNKKVDLLRAELEENNRQVLRVVTEELKKVQQGGNIISAPESQTEKSSGQQVVQQDEELLRPKSCSAILVRMHDWNECWRRHLLVSNGQPWKKPITCWIPVQSTAGETKIVEEVIGAPLYEFAYFKGQGFGRFVEYTTRLCMFAFLLKRPCLVNKAPRDAYNTWGSFIHQNTYHWDPSILHAIPEYANQLEALLMRLPAMESGIWRGAIKEEEYEKSDSLVFPMNKVFPTPDSNKALEYYSGINETIGNKVLVSPNWGEAWHTKIRRDDIFPKEHGCDYKMLEAMVQNALFAPSDLGVQLHMERVERADAALWNPSEKRDLYHKRVNTQAPITNDWRPAVRTGAHLSGTTGTMEGKPSYGAIHIRTEMINMGRKKQIQKEPLVLANALVSCLERAQPLMDKSEPFPTNWWVIADNAPTAVFVAEELQKQGKQVNSSLPVLKIYHDYGEIASSQTNDGKKKHTFEMPSHHSMSAQASGMYGHAHMAGSIMDWVALHESKVSIITRGTAYGMTGAKGNGKTLETRCGEGMFNVFIERK